MMQVRKISSYSLPRL